MAFDSLGNWIDDTGYGDAFSPSLTPTADSLQFDAQNNPILNDLSGGGGPSDTSNFWGEDGFGWGNATDIGKLALGGINTYMGMKGYGLARDQFNLNKDMALANLANQSKLTNERLSTRYGSRAQRGVSGYTPGGQAEYMSRYGATGG